jgi:cytochrome b subunit of formate dehydrogenase
MSKRNPVKLSKPGFTGVIIALLFCFGFSFGQSVDDCLMCHEDKDLTKKRDGRTISLYINIDKYTKSVHGDLECVYCHADLEGFEDFPHDENLETVDCGLCHDDIAEVYNNSLHGKEAARGVKLAPRCWDCHGKHDIMPHDSPDSRVTKFNIPFMCGGCHKEGTEVTQRYDIPQDSIITHYSQSIHGEGLYQKGLTVTAVCSDCHTAHNVLPHTDKNSSIYKDNVAKTCQKCHGQIEKVHKKVIKGELWEKEPNKIPICIDCHSPHTIRKIFYELGMSDRECLECHARKDLKTTRDGEEISLYVDSMELASSDHKQVACAQCHTGVSVHATRPCATITSKVDCSICHAEVVTNYNEGMHGRLVERGDPNAPTCLDCHGKHNIREHVDSKSPTYPTNVPDLCGRCHKEGSEAAIRYEGEQHNILKNYVMSIHGKGLLQSGLVVTAMCTDCHTPHLVLPESDSRSTVNRQNIPHTCAKCHNGIYETYITSIHYSEDEYDPERPLPMCDDCHSSHTITRTDQEGFKLNIMNQCGRCHKEVTESYFDTFHGKVSKLGYTAAAKCYDCHGAHDVLPTWNPKSRLSRQNIVKTCGQCHESSHRQFAGYLTHATHHDRNKYPFLFYTFWFMTSLLIFTFGVFGVHTILWLPRSLRERMKYKKIPHKPDEKQYLRFDRIHRRLHILVIISFLGLAITGMTLKFSYIGWAQFISHLLGGFESASYIHRVCAAITFFYFGSHLIFLFKDKRRKGLSWKRYIFSRDSMLPNRDDLKEAAQTLKWFIGLGPRPQYGRWTYWEKFDYFAVFWGVAIIGSTGLILWFPEFFTYILPGWFINVATIIHSDEALLAVGFIFTVHFFNTHFRPDRFPMDTVIFTGRIPVEELKIDRPREYEQVSESGELEKRLEEPLPTVVVKGWKIFGATALTLGIMLIILIIWAQIFGYR